MLECSLEWESSKRNHTNAYCKTTILGLSSRVTGSLPSGCLPIFGHLPPSFFEKEICAKKSSSFKAQRQMLSKPDNISYCVQPFFCKTCNPQKIWNCIAKYFCQVFSTLLHRVLKIIQRSESIFSPEGKCSATKQSFGNCRGQGLVEHHQWFFDGLLRYILPLIITDHET